MLRATAILGGALLLSTTVLVEAQAVSNEQHPTYSFSSPGEHEVTLSVCNSGGCKSITKTVTVLDPKPSIVSAQMGVATVEVGQLVPLAGSGKGQPSLIYTWRVLQGTTLVREISGATAWLDTTGLASGAYTVKLRITNASGQAESTPVALSLVETQGMDFYTVTPCRMLDTRIGAPLQSGVISLVSLDGACGVPPSARALAANVTAITPTGTGHIVLFPGNYPVPPTSTINFPAGRTLANDAILPLSSDGTGKLAVLATVLGGTVHAAIDVFGYFAPAP